MTKTPKYKPFWCEENVWNLCREADERGLEDAHAVFVSSPHRSVGMWGQRAAAPGQPIVWDYHVVVFFRAADSREWSVFDLDCRAGPELSLTDWLRVSFPFAGAVPPEVEPTFRVVEANEFLDTFRTDRSHMLDEDGSYKAEPPEWPAPHDTSNLWSFVDPSGDSPGEVFDLRGLLDRYD